MPKARGKGKMPIYNLHIRGSWPVELEEDEVPTTQAGLLQLFQDCEIDHYDLDNLELRLERDE
jgi:hypothetical protein